MALYDTVTGSLQHRIHSQTASHQPYGGVVPELASRDHLSKTLPLIQTLLADQPPIDLVAYTKGPGLIGALMVGASVAVGYAYARQVPVVGVHHMEAHMMAVMLEQEKPNYPFVALIVSGGHTMLLHVAAFGEYRLLGETLDDAAGEAFDKTAKLLHLPYPGGPSISALAQQGCVGRFQFPRPMLDRPGYGFSLSGLKTHTRQCIATETQREGGVLSDQTAADIAHAFEMAVVDTLVTKAHRALSELGIDQLVVAGGVSANQRLRAACHALPGIKAFFPRHDYCTDNAAMVAYVGSCRAATEAGAAQVIDVRSRWPISDL